MNRFQRNFKPQIFKRLNVEGMSFLMSPPKDESDKTVVELELLENVSMRLKDEDLSSIRKYNNNVLENYYHILEQFSLEVDKEEVEELLTDIRIIVENEKTKHNRSRPSTIANKQGFEIKETVSSNPTPSYPSKHSAESMFLSLYFAEQFPIYKDVMMEMANKIANSRLLSSNNYPTDNLAGQTIAHVLFGRFKESKKQ
tara:strand:+ start:1852 stop:2448 length:597 start_codon:yes stop_codon:yes gene_type:complete